MSFFHQAGVNMTALLEAKGLKKTYRIGKVLVPALRGITFNVKEEEFVAVFGFPPEAENQLSFTFWAAYIGQMKEKFRLTALVFPR